MKKRAFFGEILSVMLVFGLIFIGCDNGGDNSNKDDSASTITTGTVIIKNNSNTIRIDEVEIYDVASDVSVEVDADGIDKGKSKSYKLDPLDKMRVWIRDSGGDEYQSVQFVLRAGDSKTFTYDGFGLK